VTVATVVVIPARCCGPRLLFVVARFDISTTVNIRPVYIYRVVGVVDVVYLNFRYQVIAHYNRTHCGARVLQDIWSGRFAFSFDQLITKRGKSLCVPISPP
jgi:hypothetical protein